MAREMFLRFFAAEKYHMPGFFNASHLPKAPTLYIRAEKEPFCYYSGSWARRLNEMEGSKFAKVGSRHWMTFTHLDDVWRILKEWI